MNATGARPAAAPTLARATGVRILGPIEAAGLDGPAALSGARQRVLLAVLAVHAGTVVHQSRLIDALWGWDPPRTAVKTLHSHIARVRQALDACGLPAALHTRHAGYVLDIPATEVDAHLFESRVAAARRHLVADAPESAARELREGLALWRGDALADGEPTGWAAAEAARLNEVRLCAEEDLWEAELRLGRHRGALGELERLLVTHPYRERLVGLSMLALYRCRRPAEALDAYRRLRARLADELGTDPGPDLQRLHTAILREDTALDLVAESGLPASSPPTEAAPPSSVPSGHAAIAPALPSPEPVPAELPAPPGHFTGRDDELSALDRLLEQEGPQPRIAFVAGPGGMGKTALAVRWAHTVVHRFPDGQLYVDLGGHDPAGALPPAQALAQVLASLGVPAGRIPADTAARSALFRTLLSGRRMLVVLDNAAGPDQVLPLVPPTAASLLLVTSRSRPTALAVHHAVHAVALDALDRHAAVALLAQVLGRARVDREPAAAAELAELCGGMPLALRIAAAKLAARPGRELAELAAELVCDDRLDELSVPGDSRTVRTVFGSAYRALPAPAARLFRLLGLHPGTTYTGHLAAAAADLTLPAARRVLAELVSAHLVAEVAPDRYRYHDLLRLYARECAVADETAAARDEAVARIVDWHLAVADAANRLVDPGRDRVRAAPAYPPAQLPFIDDPVAALAFLDGERVGMQAVVRHAAEHGPQTAAWQLTYLLTGFFDSRGHWAERVELCRWGVAAANRCGDPGAEGLMRSGLGVALIMTRRFDEALDVLQSALALTRRTGDARGEGHVHNNIAVAHAGLRRHDAAVEAYQQALALHTASGNALGMALGLNNIGDAYVRMGRAELSLEYLARALPAARELGNARLEAAALSGLGQAHAALGDFGTALAHLRQALAVRRHRGDRRHEADTRNTIGVTHLRRGDHGAALDEFGRALELSREIADRHLEASALANLGRTQLERDDLVAAAGYLRLAQALRARAPDHFEAACIARDLGELARRNGDPAEARTQWQLAVDLYRKANAPAEADALADTLG
ncbi:BTAD domain-containing putative transcriptional regulator [Catellatospora sp. NPDC049133]|jgi:DNA-binding SARP family transcriptional activator/Tfp pilus assembly protein PilF|uniref:AfsR/SARP family transcriptional regulator n=1 Tax=Catellatospora sp. NPDC049133 TaxID=3155499 RepID=UPI0033EEE666